MYQYLFSKYGPRVCGSLKKKKKTHRRLASLTTGRKGCVRRRQYKVYTYILCGRMDVELALYDLSGGVAKTMSLELLGTTIEMLPHSGIRAFGREYFYSGGIQSSLPQTVESSMLGRPVSVEKLGSTSKTKKEFDDFLASTTEWTAESYDLWHHNCNNFAATCAEFLGVSYPRWILDLPSRVLRTPLGAMLEPLMRQQPQIVVEDRQEEAKIEVTMKSTDGSSEKLRLSPDTRIDSLKKYGRLVYLGKILEGSKTLADYSITTGSTIISAPSKKSAAEVEKPAASLEQLALPVLQTLSKVCGNVISHPNESKFRTLKLENAAFKKKVADVPGALGVLERAGFERDGNVLRLQAGAAKWEPLNKTKIAIDAEIDKRSPPPASRGAGLPGQQIPAGVPSPEEMQRVTERLSAQFGGGGGGPAGLGNNMMLPSPEEFQRFLSVIESDPQLMQQMRAYHQRFGGGLSPGPPSPQDLQRMTAMLRENPQFAQAVESTMRRAMAADPNAAQSIFGAVAGGQQPARPPQMPPLFPRHQAASSTPPPAASGSSSALPTTTGAGGGNSGGGAGSSTVPVPEEAMTEEEAILEAIRRSLREQ